MGLSEREARIVAIEPAGEQGIERLLQELVEIRSPSGSAVGTNAVADVVERELERLGFRVSVLVTGQGGRTLVARRRGADSHRLLLLGHGDTVHPEEGLFRGYRHQDDDRATGPGAADMKGGLAVMIRALGALHQQGALEGRTCTVVVNADEEIGSPHSGDLIRAEALEHDLCLCFEAGRLLSDGVSTFVTARKGFGRMTLEAVGKASHAGVAPYEGASAVLELCHKAIALSALGEEASGTSVTVGILSGGDAANTVPARARLELDYRFPDPESGEDLEESVLNESARNVLRSPDGRPLVATRMKDHIKRPPMVRTDAVGRMATRIVAAGLDLGLALAEESRGGSSDAALAADSGCPAVCGLGVVGGGFHTDQEWILRSSLTQRTRLAALVMDRFYHL